MTLYKKVKNELLFKKEIDSLCKKGYTNIWTVINIY